MKNAFLPIIFLLSTTLSHSQNLIPNPSFEQNGEPYCEGWYNACNSKLVCDTFGSCGTRLIPRSLPDSSGGLWSVEVYGSFPPSGAAITYITGQTGTNIYELKFWMNTEHFLGEVFIGPVKNGEFIDYNYLQDHSQPWTQYKLLDTITTNATDTIGVKLSAGLGDFCICDVAYDLIELTIIDSVSTSIEEQSDYKTMKVYPNPFNESFTIHVPGYKGFEVSIFNLDGKKMLTAKSDSDQISVDLSSSSAGTYFYEIHFYEKSLPPRHGKLIQL